MEYLPQPAQIIGNVRHSLPKKQNIVCKENNISRKIFRENNKCKIIWQNNWQNKFVKYINKKLKKNQLFNLQSNCGSGKSYIIPKLSETQNIVMITFNKKDFNPIIEKFNNNYIDESKDLSINDNKYIEHKYRNIKSNKSIYFTYIIPQNNYEQYYSELIKLYQELNIKIIVCDEIQNLSTKFGGRHNSNQYSGSESNLIKNINFLIDRHLVSPLLWLLSFFSILTMSGTCDGWIHEESLILSMYSFIEIYNIENIIPKKFQPKITEISLKKETDENIIESFEKCICELDKKLPENNNWTDINNKQTLIYVSTIEKKEKLKKYIENNYQEKTIYSYCSDDKYYNSDEAYSANVCIFIFSNENGYDNQWQPVYCVINIRDDSNIGSTTRDDNNVKSIKEEQKAYRIRKNGYYICIKSKKCKDKYSFSENLEQKNKRLNYNIHNIQYKLYEKLLTDSNEISIKECFEKCTFSSKRQLFQFSLIISWVFQSCIAYIKKTSKDRDNEFPTAIEIGKQFKNTEPDIFEAIQLKNEIDDTYIENFVKYFKFMWINHFVAAAKHEKINLFNSLTSTIELKSKSIIDLFNTITKPNTAIDNVYSRKCPFVNSNPKIKNLFNNNILPHYIDYYFEHYPFLNIILCDNDLNTINSLSKLRNFDKINITVVEINENEYNHMKSICSYSNVNFINDSLQNYLNTNLPNKATIIYADTCGGCDMNEHIKMINTSINKISDIIFFGTFTTPKIDQLQQLYNRKYNTKIKIPSYSYGRTSTMGTYFVMTDKYKTYIKEKFNDNDLESKDLLELDCQYYKEIIILDQ